VAHVTGAHYRVRTGLQEEAEEELRHQQEAADAVPKFFTWRLGLRVLVVYLVFRGAPMLPCFSL
jgi:hypothetical protein